MRIKWIEEQLELGGLFPEGEETLRKELEYRREALRGVGLPEVQDPPTTDTLSEIAPSVESPAGVEAATEKEQATAEALSGLGRVKGMLKWLKEKKESNSSTLEKIEGVAEIAGKGLDWFHKQKILKVVGGAALLGAAFTPVAPVAITVGVAFKALSATAATKAMYDSMATRLNKQYEEMGDVSHLRKTTMKAGALVVAATAGFFGSQIAGDLIEESGILDKIASLNVRDLFPAYAGTVPTQYAGTMPTQDELGNHQNVAPATIDNNSWSNNQGSNVSQAPLPVDAGLAANESVAPAKPPVSQGSWNGGTVGTRPDVAVTTPSGTPAGQPSFGFDAASAPPVGATEIKDINGKLLGWNLPDGTSMTTEGKIMAPEGSTLVLDPKTNEPTNLLRFPDGRIMDYTNGNITDAPTLTKPPTTYAPFGDEIPVEKVTPPQANPVAIAKDIQVDGQVQTAAPNTLNKFDLGVEESHTIVREGGVAAAPALPAENVWKAGEGVLLDSNGQQVQNGFSASPAAPVEKFETFTKPAELGTTTPDGGLTEAGKLHLEDISRPNPVANGPEVANVTTTPIAPENLGLSEAERLHLEEMSRPNPDVVVALEQTQAVTAPAPAQPFKISFIADPVVVSNDPNLKSFASNNDILTAVMEAATEVDDAKSWTGSFLRGKGNLPSMTNFMNILNANPTIKVVDLLNFDLSTLPSAQKEVLMDAKGVLTRVFSANSLSRPEILNSSIVQALQNTYKS